MSFYFAENVFQGGVYLGPPLVEDIANPDGVTPEDPVLDPNPECFIDFSESTPGRQILINQGGSFYFKFYSPDGCSDWDFSVSLREEVSGSSELLARSGSGAYILTGLSPSDTKDISGDYLIISTATKEGREHKDVLRLHVGLMG